MVTEWEQVVQDRIAEGGLGKLVHLSGACRDNYYYVDAKASVDHLLPVKLKIACDTKTGRKFSGLDNPFTLALLLWVPEDSESRFALLEQEDIRVKAATMNAVQKHTPKKVYDKTQLAKQLHQIYVSFRDAESLLSLADLRKITKHVQLTRDERKALPSPQETESVGMKQLSRVLGEAAFHLTLPGLLQYARILQQ